MALVYERQLPSAPTNVSVTAPPGEDGTLEVSWDAPDAGGTFPIEYYLVEFRPVGDARRFVRSHVPVGETSVRRTDLQTGVDYRVLVQALSGDGYGDPVTRTVATHGVRRRALQAWFESPPKRHDGTKRVEVRVAFSEPIDESPENVGEYAGVAGGQVASSVTGLYPRLGYKATEAAVAAGCHVSTIRKHMTGRPGGVTRRG